MAEKRKKQKKKKKKKYRALRNIIIIQLVLLLFILLAVVYYNVSGYAGEVGRLRKEAERLVSASSEEDFKSAQTGVLYAADGTEISRLRSEKDAYYVPIEEIPLTAVSAVISIEDKRFYRHGGVDYKALLRAFKAMVENGEATQGGSTITMQLARTIYLTQEKTWQRKVEEIFIAQALERKYSKKQIIEFYLNNIYYGNGYYGIQAASRGYFNRGVQELNLSEIAFLSAIPNNPTIYDPLTQKENTLARRDLILENMYEDGKISQQAYLEAVSADIRLRRPAVKGKNDYVETYACDCAIRALMEQEGFLFRYHFLSETEKNAYDDSYQAVYNECRRKLYTGGYQIYTSLDLEMQEELQASLDEELAEFTDVNEEGIFMLQASAVCIDNVSGFVKAIVGGRSQDFTGYSLNRAFQSFRQPGSSVKPLIVYTPSLERGYTADTMVTDEPVEDGPKNANGTYLGDITLRTAVEKSVNVIAWKLFDELSPETGLGYLEEMNFSRLNAEDYRLPSALGGFTTGASALEMASAYAALENDGIYRKPTCVVKILDSEGTLIFESDQSGKHVYKQNAARAMTDILTGVLASGTGRGLALTDMPCAGKTGTTDDRKDGWFVGYTRYYTTSVWVGCDMPKKVDGLEGATYPGRIWNSFMEKMHKNLQPLEFLRPAEMTGDYKPPGFSEEETENSEAPTEGEEPSEGENLPGGDDPGSGGQGIPVVPEQPTPPENPPNNPENPPGTPENPPNNPENPPETPENLPGTPENPPETPENPPNNPENPPGTPENPPNNPENPPEEPPGGEDPANPQRLSKTTEYCLFWDGFGQYPN